MLATRDRGASGDTTLGHGWTAALAALALSGLLVGCGGDSPMENEDEDEEDPIYSATIDVPSSSGGPYADKSFDVRPRGDAV